MQSEKLLRLAERIFRSRRAQPALGWLYLLGRSIALGNALSRQTARQREQQATFSPPDFRSPSSGVKAVAFYLPQYHAFEINSKTWGDGFTDWENVARALPVFHDHYQPKLAADFGYYDLSSGAIQRKQCELARNAGLYGFCYHTYWFDPATLMRGPIDFHKDELDFPFMLCWANEPWTRRWDGMDKEVIVAQPYREGYAERAADYFCGYFESPKYIRIGDRPVFIVYRTDAMQASEFARVFKARVNERLGVEPVLVNALSFRSPAAPTIGFDRSVFFPPHGAAREPALKPLRTRYFAGTIATYSGMCRSVIADYAKDEHRTTYPTVCPGWDNSARKPEDGWIFADADPSLFFDWIRASMAHLRKNMPPQEHFLFVNAWNEWAEGAFLEPDRVHGFQSLNALSKALSYSP